jgi:hypothetical protein
MFQLKAHMTYISVWGLGEIFDQYGFDDIRVSYDKRW